METLACPDSVPTFLGYFDLSIAPPLLFYSYIPIILVSLAFGLFVYFKDNFSSQGKILFLISASFSAWIFNILIQWIGVNADLVYFSWQLTALFEIPIYILSLGFIYVFIKKEKLTNREKTFLCLPYLPVILLLPTQLNITYFDLINCEGVIGRLWDYIYIIEIAAIVWISFIGIRTILKSKDVIFKKQLSLLTGGMVLFLTTFFISNYAGELTKTYEFNLVGPLGMVAFLAFFSYTIVRFKTLHIRIIGANVLVIIVWIAVFSLIFIGNIEIIHKVIVFTFILLLFIGGILLRSISNEVKQREQIESLATNLSTANNRLRELDQQKSEFISLASHQLRGPLTAIKGYASLILEGDYGNVPKEVKEAVETMYRSTQALVVIVGDYLDISRIELGKMKYDFTDFDLKTLAKTICGELEPTVKLANLSLTFTEPKEGEDYMVHADQGKIKQVIANLIDNSIKYTKKGGVNVSVNRTQDRIHIAIKDTGVGIPTEVLPRLFEKFTRAPDASKTNIMGTGLGLYVARKMMEAHQGRVWAESEGKDKGSTFFIELEAVNKDKPHPEPYIPEFHRS